MQRAAIRNANRVELIYKVWCCLAEAANTISATTVTKVALKAAEREIHVIMFSKLPWL